MYKINFTSYNVKQVRMVGGTLKTVLTETFKRKSNKLFKKKHASEKSFENGFPNLR